MGQGTVLRPMKSSNASMEKWVRELRPLTRTVYDGEINPSKDELDGGRFWTLEEIRAAIGQQILTPNFESEFQRFFL